MNDIPIIGQPKIREWQLTLVIECSCKELVVVTGKVGTMSACKCGKVFVIGDFESQPGSTNLNVQLGIARVPK